MNNQNITKPLFELEKGFKRVMNKAPLLAGNEMLNFAQDNFRKGGFQGATFQKWNKRKNPNKWGQKDKNPGRAVLVKKGALKRDGRLSHVTTEQAVIAYSLPYAKAHNEGINGIGVIQSVGSYTRKNGQQVQAHKRRITMRLVARKFIDNSPVANQRIKRVIAVEILKEFKR